MLRKIILIFLITALLFCPTLESFARNNIAQDFNKSVAITSGTINNTTIGATTPSTGKFTLLDVDNLRLDGNTIASTGKATFSSTTGGIDVTPTGGDTNFTTGAIQINGTSAISSTRGGNFTTLVGSTYVTAGSINKVGQYIYLGNTSGNKWYEIASITFNARYQYATIEGSIISSSSVDRLKFSLYCKQNNDLGGVPVGYLYFDGGTNSVSNIKAVTTTNDAGSTVIKLVFYSQYGYNDVITNLTYKTSGSISVNNSSVEYTGSSPEDVIKSNYYGQLNCAKITTLTTNGSITLTPNGTGLIVGSMPFSGAFQNKIQTVTAASNTINSDTGIVIGDTTANAVDVALPDANTSYGAGYSRMIRVRLGTKPGSNNMTVSRADTNDRIQYLTDLNKTTATMDAAGEWVVFSSAGANLWVAESTNGASF